MAGQTARYPVYPFPRHPPQNEAQSGRSLFSEERRGMGRRLSKGKRLRLHRRRRFLPHRSGRVAHFPRRRPERLALGRRIHPGGSSPGRERLAPGTGRVGTGSGPSRPCPLSHRPPAREALHARGTGVCPTHPGTLFRPHALLGLVR